MRTHQAWEDFAVAVNLAAKRAEYRINGTIELDIPALSSDKGAFAGALSDLLQTVKDEAIGEARSRALSLGTGKATTKGGLFGRSGVLEKLSNVIPHAQALLGVYSDQKLRALARRGKLKHQAVRIARQTLIEVAARTTAILESGGGLGMTNKRLQLTRRLFQNQYRYANDRLMKRSVPPPVLHAPPHGSRRR